MSTKIYTAYKSEDCIASVINKLTEVRKEILDEYFQDVKKYIDVPKKHRNDGVSMHYRIIAWKMSMWKNQWWRGATEPDMDVDIYIHSDFIYFIPRWRLLSHDEKFDKEFTEFGYRDNQDKAEAVSNEERDIRGNIWNEIIEKSNELKDAIRFSVIDYDSVSDYYYKYIY